VVPVVVIMVVVVVMPMIVTLMLVMALLTTLFVALFVALFTPFLAPLVLLMALVFRTSQRLLAVMLPLTNIGRLIFPGPYEIHLPVARMVFVAMQAPGPGVFRRNMQVQRLCHNHMRRRLLDDDWLGVDQSRWRPPSEIHAAVNTRRNLSPNGD